MKEKDLYRDDEDQEDSMPQDPADDGYLDPFDDGTSYDLYDGQDVRDDEWSESTDTDDADFGDFDLSDYTDYDYETYNDSGEYRSYDGNHEYRSFDASLPDASPDDWYHYSDEDSELEDSAGDFSEEYDSEPEPRHKGLKIFAHALLVFFTVLSAIYLFALYSNISFVSNLRTMYIQTAMSTLNHKWMATAIIPGDIIDDVMRTQYEADAAADGIESNWGTVQVQALPSFTVDNTASEASPAETQAASSEEATAQEESPKYESADEQTFFELFWELDYDSVKQYMSDHPDALSNGWSGVDINESGLNDDGTSMKTIYGDQVLAVNAVDGIMLARIYLSSNNSRGVLAICKDTSRLSLCAASTLGTIGQTAGRICDANDGILSMTGSAFMDDGTGNGGQISGLAVCSGTTYGERLGGVGDKRLELRDDNKMYIVDSSSSLGSGTRDACEFHPALIIDGDIISSDWNSPNPRAVLGQTERLETMMVVVEGRLSDSLGCGVEDVAEKMKQYGCVQALNLDGGTSAMMYYKGEYINRCSNTALPGGRTLPTAWVYK